MWQGKVIWRKVASMMVCVVQWFWLGVLQSLLPKIQVYGPTDFAPGISHAARYEAYAARYEA